MPTEFTPLQSLIGGGLIGFAVVLLMAFQGKIAGISGIVSGAIFGEEPSERLWRSLFLIGIAAAPLLLIFGAGVSVEVSTVTPLGAIAVGGLLVGVGTSLGAGCTSGHGVCGLGRFSKRSLVAVPVFMAATAATVFVMRHIAGGL